MIIVNIQNEKALGAAGQLVLGLSCDFLRAWSSCSYSPHVFLLPENGRCQALCNPR